MTLLEHFVSDKLAEHPLPWSIEYDWCVEVWDSGSPSRTVMKLQSDQAARELVGMAQRLAGEFAVVRADFERMMADESAF